MADNTVKEGQDADIEVTYLDQDSDAQTPTSAEWWLYDKDSQTVINARTAVAYVPAASTESIKLLAADNVFITSGRTMEIHTFEVRFVLDTGYVGRDSFDFPVVNQINVT